MTHYLELGNWVAIVLKLYETPDELLTVRSDGAEIALLAPQATLPDGNEFYPDMHTKAAILLDELLACRAIPDEVLHRLASLVATLTFLDLNGHMWRPDPEQLRYWVEQCAAGRVASRILAQAIAVDCTCP